MRNETIKTNMRVCVFLNVCRCTHHSAHMTSEDNFAEPVLLPACESGDRLKSEFEASALAIEHLPGQRGRASSFQRICAMYPGLEG